MKVYCLYEKETLKIRYIGITKNNLKQRLYEHLKIKKNPHKDNWINKLNGQIGIRLIKSFDSKEDARELELYLIRTYKDSHKLVNLQDRGFCGDKRIASKVTCEKISNTLKKKYASGELKVIGGKGVYAWDYTGDLIGYYKNSVHCEKTLNVPKKKIGNICNHGGYYAKYTFTRESELPIERYIRCYDFELKQLFLCLKKEDICKVLKIKKFFNKNINSDKFYLQRYNVRVDNKFPPISNGRISVNGVMHNCIESVMNSSKFLLFTWRSEIKNSLDSLIPYKRGDFFIEKCTCAGYKFGELLETPEGFKTKEELETVDLNV